MSREPLNDTDSIGGAFADGSGHAALLLSESMLHGLIARRILSASDAMEIVGSAVDVQRDALAELSDPDPTLEKSLSHLIAIQRSLDTDLILD